MDRWSPEWLPLAVAAALGLTYWLGLRIRRPARTVLLTGVRMLGAFWRQIVKLWLASRRVWKTKYAKPADYALYVALNVPERAARKTARWYKELPRDERTLTLRVLPLAPPGVDDPTIEVRLAQIEQASQMVRDESRADGMFSDKVREHRSPILLLIACTLVAVMLAGGIVVLLGPDISRGMRNFMDRVTHQTTPTTHR